MSRQHIPEDPVPGGGHLDARQLRAGGVRAPGPRLRRHVRVYQRLSVQQPVCAQLPPGRPKGKDDLTLLCSRLPRDLDNRSKNGEEK